MTKLHFESSILELRTKKKDLKWVKSDLNEYYIGELFSPEEYVSIEKQVRLIAEGHQRLVWPLYTFVLTFLSLAVFLRQPYNKKAGSKPIIIAAIFITIVVCAHFTLQNFISKNTFFLPVYYANLVIANLVGIWFYNQKRI
jgi:lipopolysaccharide export system permease protein